jgi:O-antigen ligase
VLATVDARPRLLDWLAWSISGLSLVSAGFTVVSASVSGLRSVDFATATLILLPLAGVVAALSAYHDRPNVRERTASPGWQLDVAVGGLAGLALVSAMAAGNVAVAFHEFHVVFLDAAVFYALIRLLRPVASGGESSWRFHHLLVGAFLAGATLMAAYSVYQFVFTDSVITAEGVKRALGVYGSPNNLALLLGRSTPILISLTVFSGRPVRWRWLPMLTGVALLVNLVGLGLTFSRGALLLGLPTAVLFLLLVQGRKLLAGVLALLAAVVGGILPVLGTERLRSLLDLEAGTGFFRLRLWQSAITMLSEHPWLGVGPDNFLYAYRTRYILPDAWQEPNLSHPHNILLDFGTRLGVGSIALLVWLQVSFWRLSARVYDCVGGGLNRALILGLMGSMVATLVHGLVDNSVFLVDLALVFVMTLAVVANAADDEAAMSATSHRVR